MVFLNPAIENKKKNLVHNCRVAETCLCSEDDETGYTHALMQTPCVLSTCVVIIGFDSRQIRELSTLHITQLSRTNVKQTPLQVAAA